MFDVSDLTEKQFSEINPNYFFPNRNQFDESAEYSKSMFGSTIINVPSIISPSVIDHQLQAENFINANYNNSKFG